MALVPSLPPSPASSEPSVSFLFLFVWRTKAVLAAKGNEFKETAILDFLRTGECAHACVSVCECVHLQEHTHVHAHTAEEEMAHSLKPGAPRMWACADEGPPGGPLGGSRGCGPDHRGGAVGAVPSASNVLLCRRDALVDETARSAAVSTAGSGGQPDVTPSAFSNSGGKVWLLV